ncbi:hypothetical protein D3C71_2048100 [compost metagenome]
MQLRVVHAHLGRGAGRIELRTQVPVGPYATGDHHALQTGLLERGQRLLHQHFDNRSLGARR